MLDSVEKDLVESVTSHHLEAPWKYADNKRALRWSLTGQERTSSAKTSGRSPCLDLWNGTVTTDVLFPVVYIGGLGMGGDWGRRYWRVWGPPVRRQALILSSGLLCEKLSPTGTVWWLFWALEVLVWRSSIILWRLPSVSNVESLAIPWLDSCWTEVSFAPLYPRSISSVSSTNYRTCG